MVVITVYTLPNCPNCPKAKKIVEEVASEENCKVRHVNLDDEDGQIEGLMYQIAVTPAVRVGERVIAAGEVPTKKQLLEAIKEERLFSEDE